MELWLPRAAQYMGITLLVSWPVFWLLIVRPSLAAADISAATLERPMRTRWRWLWPIGTFVLCAGALADMVLNTLTVRFPDQSLSDVLWLYVTGTRYGRFAAIRLVLALAAAVGARAFLRHGRTPMGVATVLLGLAAMATFSLSGHAYSQGTAWTIALDWVHSAAVLVWAGGLISFALVGREGFKSLSGDEQRRALASLTRRFSGIALAAVPILAIAGGLLARNNLYGPEALLESPYGQPLGLKLLLTAVALTAASVNLLFLRPRLADEAKTPTPRFLADARSLSALVRVEALCVLGALGAAGLLTSRAPTPEWGELGTRVQREIVLGSMHALVALEPASARSVRLTIFPSFQDDRRPPATFELDGRMPGHKMGEIRVRARPTRGGAYVADFPLSMPGPWEIALKPEGGAEQGVVRFVAKGGGRYIPGYRFAPPAALETTISLLGVASGLVFALAGGLLIWAGQRRRLPLYASLVGAALTAAGVSGVLAVTYVRAYPTTFARNPVPNTPAQIQAGAELFAVACAECHGRLGRGDGPAAPGLGSLPDFADPHMAGHRDGELYWWISHGVPDTKMPAFQQALTETQIWQVIRFLRTLAPVQTVPR